MDLHLLILISCVFLASLFSLLFINKFCRRKTFEEVIAEKKAAVNKIYATSKVNKKQLQKKIALKKDLKKDKKQKQKDSQKELELENDSNNDSDGHSETVSVENSPSHQKAHIEFEPEPEIVDDSDSTTQSRPSVDSNANKSNKQGKRKGNAKSGILVNKNEPVVVVKEVQATVLLNHFETKPPKDAVELKRQENESKKSKDNKKSNKNVKKEIESEIIKEIKQFDEKSAKNSNESPKNQTNNKGKQQKKTDVDFTILDKLNGSDSIGVNFMMKLFSRAELNRNEIQILIDYLLNKQQDMPANHSDWSDDVVQKLRKQLEEKDKALQEEQESSTGIQAKLRDLRLEINTERAQTNATTKVYMDEIQSKKLEINNLNQEMQNLTEKFNLERQQFQKKLHLEKQSSSQEYVAQIVKLGEHNTLLQNELVQKNAYINELQLASHQVHEDTQIKTNEIIQQQAQIHALEQHMSEFEKESVRIRYELDVAKLAESEKEAGQVEIQHLQSSLDSAKAELNSVRNELNDTKSQVDSLTTQNEELSKNLLNSNNKNQEQNELQVSADKYKSLCAEKDTQIAEYTKNLKQLESKEDELIKQIQEQKEKNNDLRTKNWKLVEALQTAETANKSINNKKINLVQQSSNTTSSIKEQEKLRQLIERLCPEAVKKNAGSALSLSFDQWVEQILATHVKEQLTSSNNAEFNNKHSSSKTNHTSSNHTSHNHNSLTNSEDFNSNSSQNSSTDEETQKLKLQNDHLRTHIDELTKIVYKTENMLINLESQARDQDAHWRSVVRSKDDEIHVLKTSNGEQDI